MSKAFAGKPLVYDTAKIRFRAIYELGELYRYRYLIINLVKRDLKVRYKRSVLGFIWVMLNPLLMTLVLTIVFTNLLRFKVEHFPSYLLGGILVFNLFAQGSVAAMSNLTGNAGTLRRIYIPPSAFVASAIGSALVNLFFALIPFFLVALVTGVQPSWTWVLIFIPCLAMAVLSFGVGLIVSALMVFFNDTFEIYSVLIMVMTYLTPIFYPVSILPKRIILAEKYNPLYLAIDTFREVTINGVVPHLSEFVGLLGIVSIVFLTGWLIFTRLESRFAYHY